MPPDTSEGEIRRRYIRALAAPPARDRLGTSGIAAPPAWQRVSAAKGQRVKKNLYGRVAENRRDVFSSWNQKGRPEGGPLTPGYFLSDFQIIHRTCRRRPESKAAAACDP
jgi:hypothetical protein